MEYSRGAVDEIASPTSRTIGSRVPIQPTVWRNK
jgi:hypothetical protein